MIFDFGEGGVRGWAVLYGREEGKRVVYSFSVEKWVYIIDITDFYTSFETEMGLMPVFTYHLVIIL